MVCVSDSSILTPPDVLENTKDRKYLEIYTPNNTYIIDQFINSNIDCPFLKPKIETKSMDKLGYGDTDLIKIEIIDKIVKSSD